MNAETKVVVTVAEMARMCGLSRARFYQLLGTAFPWPVYDIFSRRPHYDEEAQRVCLEVRRKNCGVDGRPILFYARRLPTPSPRTPRSASKNNCSELINGLRALGLSPSLAQVESMVKELFPKGTDAVHPGDVVRSVFI